MKERFAARVQALVYPGGEATPDALSRQRMELQALVREVAEPVDEIHIEYSESQ